MTEIFEKGPIAVANRATYWLFQCYARPSNGDSNARFERTTYRHRQPENPTLVGPTLEGTGDVPCLQDDGLDHRSACCEHSEARGGCKCKQYAHLSSYLSQLQILRAFYVFQRCADGSWRNVCAFSSSNDSGARVIRRIGRRRHSWFFKSFCSSQLSGPNKEKRLIRVWPQADQSRGMFRRARRCGRVTWAAL